MAMKIARPQHPTNNTLGNNTGDMRNVRNSGPVDAASTETGPTGATGTIMASHPTASSTATPSSPSSAPTTDDPRLREERLNEGLCPNCGTRLYSKCGGVGIGSAANKANALMGKLWKKKGSGDGNSTTQCGNHRMVPLTIAGVVERGQCVKCVGKGNNSRAASAAGVDAAVAMSGDDQGVGTARVDNGAGTLPAVKAVPVLLDPSVTRAPHVPKAEKDGKKEEEEVDIPPHNRKHPPEEDLLGLDGASNNGIDTSTTAASKIGLAAASDAGAAVAFATGRRSSQFSTDDYDDDMEEVLPLLDLCQIDEDHTASSLVDNLNSEDDRKPAAKLSNTSNSSSNMSHIEQSAERIRKLREEAAVAQRNVDVAFLEDTTSSWKSPPQAQENGKEHWKCPNGMSADVFYQLPAEMQKEYSEQDEKSSACGSCDKVRDGVDPEFLASLPDSIRQEVLEQANNGNNNKTSSAPTSLTSKTAHPLIQIRSKSMDTEQPNGRRQSLIKDRKALSKSTQCFLNSTGIDVNDFESFPEEIQNDIMAEKRRSSAEVKALPPTDEYESDIDDYSVNDEYSSHEEGASESDGEVMESSGYDPEMLASLPEDVRKEVLDQEKQERKRLKNKSQKNIEKSSQSRNGKQATGAGGGSGGKGGGVGAHRVNIPAGYDPETFQSLPEDVQRELIEDAARTNQARINGAGYAAAGYDLNSILDAVVVPAHAEFSSGTTGPSTSCTYKGEYNVLGKRHGDGELKWANGDRYVGKFKDGLIEGRGTINFHDGTEYSGQWSKNRFHGEGTRRFNNGNVYTGHYEAGKRHGQGRCYFANGDMYVGDWKDDTIHGFGRYYYNNGHSFEGMFRNGKRNGRGKYQLTDGRVEIYRYVNDSRVGDGVRWSANRKKAWRMLDGKVKNRVSMEEAAAIANRCGPVLEES